MHRNKNGFTLVELAIVLVVIGLVVGGITIGRALIANSQLQVIASDFANYKQALTLFREKYKSLPGDMPNATQIWGTDPDGCTSNVVSETVKRTTCNGNGDGMIGGYSTSPTTIDTPDEVTRAWQQLANAEFIRGGFSGAGSNDGVTWWKPGRNIPTGRVSSVNGYTISFSRHVNTGATAFAGDYGHVIIYGAATTRSNTQTAYSPGLNGNDALSIDRAIDDGRPGQGMLRSFTTTFATTPTCASSASAETAAYVKSDGVATCSLIFITGL